MLLAHHIEVTILGHHFEPEGVLEHLVALSATGVIVLLAAYGAYTLGRRLLERFRGAERLAPVRAERGD